jgi:hypothetical protein
MKMPIPKIDKNRTQVDEAIDQARRDVQKAKNYKYTLDIDRALMIEFMSVCKLEKSSAVRELTKFIERYLQSREGKFSPQSKEDGNPGK